MNIIQNNIYKKNKYRWEPFLRFGGSLVRTDGTQGFRKNPTPTSTLRTMGIRHKDNSGNVVSNKVAHIDEYTSFNTQAGHSVELKYDPTLLTSLWYRYSNVSSILFDLNTAKNLELISLSHHMVDFAHLNISALDKLKYLDISNGGSITDITIHPNAKIEEFYLEGCDVSTNVIDKIIRHVYDSGMNNIIISNNNIVPSDDVCDEYEVLISRGCEITTAPVCDSEAPYFTVALQTTDSTMNSLSFMWESEDNVGVTSQRVQYRKTGNSTWININIGSSATTHTISDLTFGTSYDVRIWARDAKGNVGYSNVVTESTVDEHLYLDYSEKNVGVLEDTFDLQIESNTEWVLTTDTPWLSFNTINGTNNGVVEITYEDNVNPTEREGVITVSTESGKIVRTLTVIQEATYLTLTKYEMDAASDGTANGFSVRTNTYWEITINDDFLELSEGSPTSGVGDSIAITVLPKVNEGPARTGTITVTGGGITRVFTVNQESGEVESSCSSYIAINLTNSSDIGGIILGNLCEEYPGGAIMTTSFKFTDEGYYYVETLHQPDPQNPGIGLRCDKPHSPRGTVVTSIPYKNGIITDSQGEIRKLDSTYTSDNVEYELYVIWKNPNTESAHIYDVYVICKNGETGGDNGDGGDNGGGDEPTPTLHEQQYQWFPSEQAACESIGDHTTVRTTYYTERPDFYNPGTIYEDPEGTIMAAGGIYKEFSGPLWIEWTGSVVTRQGSC